MNEFLKTEFLLNKLYEVDNNNNAATTTTINQSEDNNLIKSFMPCEYSALRRQYVTIYAFNYEKCHHKILETCKLQRIPYFTCIEYKDNIECVQRHICDILPVHIGLNLDRQIYKLIYGQEELDKPEVQKTMYDLFGTIFVVSPQFFSNIFTNRKEIIHSSKELDKLYNIYLYDIHDRGHRIWLSNNNKCIFRNSNGIEHVIEDTPSFNKFISTLEYKVDKKHLDFTKMFKVFIQFHIKYDIDDLANKNILCCINLLQRGIRFATRNPSEVCKIFRFGSLDKFASKNITYHSSNDSKGKKNYNSSIPSTSLLSSSSSSSNHTSLISTIEAAAATTIDTEKKIKKNLKRSLNVTTTTSVQEEQQKIQMINLMNSNSAGPASNHYYENLAQNYKTLSPTNLVHSSESYDRHIKRPVPKNVHTIPIGTEFFICMADTQINVNSPHKWLRLLPNIILTNHLIIKYSPTLNNINDLLNTLLYRKYIIIDDDDVDGNNVIDLDYNKKTSEEIKVKKMILINGGIPTRYILNPEVDVISFFFICKSLCSFIECLIDENYIILSLTYGVPMRPISMDIINEFWPKKSKDNNDIDDDNNNNHKVLFMSPLDMKNIFLQNLRKFLYDNLLGNGCPDNMRKYFKYSIPAKVHSVYTFNNRFISDITAVPYYDLTCENSFIYINNVYRKDSATGQCENLLNKKESTINLKTIYSSDPYLTCDGYILSDAIHMDTLMKQKCRFEFEFHKKTDILIWSKDLPTFGNTNNQIKVYDAYNNCIKIYHLIFTLIRYSKRCLRYKLFNQAKISLFCYPFNDGWKYYLYKYYNEEAFISPTADYEMSVIFTTPIDRKFIKNISLMICTSCKQPQQYTGQKLYEICGQKGLCLKQSTERFQKYYNLPQKPDLVVSLFSAIGRTPIMTLKTMIDNLTEEENLLKEKILYGNCEYVLLKNISSLFCSYGNMRVDISLVKIFLANNLNLTIFLLQQDEQNNGRVLSKSFCESLGVYGLIKVNFIMYDEFGKSYNVFVNTFKTNNY